MRHLRLACLIFIILNAAFAWNHPASAQQRLPKLVTRLGRGSVTGIALSPDQKTLAVNGSQGVSLYDLTTPDASPRLLAYEAPDPTISLLPPRQVMMQSNTSAERPWDLPPGVMGGGGGGGESLPTGFGGEVAFSHDGSMLASIDGGVWLWDIKSGQGQQILTLANDVQFSKNGRLLLASTGLWDITSHEQKLKLSPGIHNAQFSPDGAYLAFIDQDSHPVLRTLATDQQQVLTTRAQILAFDPTGKWFAYSDYDQNTTRIVDLTTDHNDVTLMGHLPSRNAFSGDGKFVGLVPSEDESTIQVWNLNTLTKQVEVKPLEENAGVLDIGFSADSKILAAAYAAPNSDVGVVFHARLLPILLWDLTTGQRKTPLRIPGDQLNSRIVFIPQGYAITVDTSSTIRVWRLATRELVRTITGYTGVLIEQVAFNAEKRLLVNGSDTFTTTLFDLNPRTGEQNLLVSAFGVRAEISPDATRFTLADFDGLFSLWTLRPALEERQIAEHIRDAHSAFSPGSKWLAVTTENGIELWDAQQQKQVAILPSEGVQPSSLVFSPDESLLAILANGTVRIWSLDANRVILQGDFPDVQTITFSADSKLLAALNAKRLLRVWTLSTGDSEDYATSCDRPYRIGITPKNQSALVNCTGTPDGVVTIPLSPSGEAVPIFNQFTGSPDGQFYAFAGTVWNTSTGQQVENLNGDAIAFSPDGKWIAVGRYGGIVDLWAVR